MADSRYLLLQYRDLRTAFATHRRLWDAGLRRKNKIRITGLMDTGSWWRNRIGNIGR